MRRGLIVFALFVLLVTACAPESAPTEEAANPTDTPTKAPVPEDSASEASPIGPAEEAVIQQLAANLRLKESDITVIRSEETEFSDACLGVAMEGVMCAQVITPGRTILLEADGLQYEYHTSEDGSQIQPATLALVWKREGGIAGFCDSLTIFLSGEVYSSSCKPQTDGRMGSFADLLSAKEQQQFKSWISDLAEAKLDDSDPKGVADRMVVTLDFWGTGTKPPTEAQQQALFSFAQHLHQELAK